MKKKWVEPEILVQQFVANEYVAACYKIRCTTPNGNDWFNYLFEDTNKNGVWDEYDKLLYHPKNGGKFQGCNEWHKGVIQDKVPEVNGFVTQERHPGQDKGCAVLWWIEDLEADSDYHVMTPGNENFETNPNAS